MIGKQHCAHCLALGEMCFHCGIRFAHAVEWASDVILTFEHARDLATIQMHWNESRRARGLEPRTLHEVLAQILRVVREDVEAGVKAERKA